jgi:hypothetical protein
MEKRGLLRWRGCETEEIHASLLILASYSSENIYYRRSILVDSGEVIFGIGFEK